MQLKIYIIFVIFISAITAQINQNTGLLYEGDRCTIDNSVEGVCKKLNQCSIILQELKTMKTRPMTCGFDGFTPIVCCPRPKTILLNTTRTTATGKLAAKCTIAKDIQCVLWLHTMAGFLITANLKAWCLSIKTAIGWPLADGTGYAWNCGGSLISENYVLTAAHCTAKSDPSFSSFTPTIAKLGTLSLKDTSGSALFVAIVQIIIHPQYRPPNKYNDIALLKLAEQVSMGLAYKPACLVQTNDFNTENLNALGWGKTATSETSDILQQVTLQVVDNQSCNAGYRNRRVLPNGIIDSQICAGANGTQDTCQGDSGGPLLFRSMCTEYIVGVTSFGIGCGGVMVPGVYTRVSSYIDWIEGIVWEK